MTDETNASLLFAILPSVSAVCQSDPETASKLREIFVRVEKHAPGFSGDFVRALYEEGNGKAQFPFDATMLALSGQPMTELKKMHVM